MAYLSASSSSYLRVLVFSLVCLTISAHLLPTFYQKVCPKALPTIKRVVKDAVRQERRTGASLLRLHFHDCFVNGCDGSVLLDSTATFETEKTAFQNNNSLRRLEVVDRIKAEVDRVCGGPIVSCADILAVAARDSVVELGGPTWQVQLGRRDSTTASRATAESNLPIGNFSLSALLENFQRQGLDITDLVVLSAGHTIGFARCTTFRTRIYNETNIDPKFARKRQATCPLTGGDANLAPWDRTPDVFDVGYFKKLRAKRGLLHSDQELFNGGEADDLVRSYSKDSASFRRDFANSMIKMGNISPLTGSRGQIRVNCRRVN